MIAGKLRRHKERHPCRPKRRTARNRERTASHRFVDIDDRRRRTAQ